jgi:hypothetical protein
VVEQRRARLPVRAPERQYREFRVEGAGRAHRVVARADPEDRVVLQQQPAVLADGRFLAEAEVEGRVAALEFRVGFLRGLRDGLLHAAAEEFVALVAVDRHGTRGVVRVRAVDEDV